MRMSLVFFSKFPFQGFFKYLSSCKNITVPWSCGSLLWHWSLWMTVPYKHSGSLRTGFQLHSIPHTMWRLYCCNVRQLKQMEGDQYVSYLPYTAQLFPNFPTFYFIAPKWQTLCSLSLLLSDRAGAGLPITGRGGLEIHPATSLCISGLVIAWVVTEVGWVIYGTFCQGDTWNCWRCNDQWFVQCSPQMAAVRIAWLEVYYHKITLVHFQTSMLQRLTHVYIEAASMCGTCKVVGKREFVFFCNRCADSCVCVCVTKEMTEICIGWISIYYNIKTEAWQLEFEHQLTEHNK